MNTFTFKCVATTGEVFEITITAVSYRAAVIKMARARRAAFGTNKIWMYLK